MVSTGVCLALAAVEWRRNRQKQIIWQQKFILRCCLISTYH